MDGTDNDCAGNQRMTRAQFTALTIIAATLIVGTVAFGVLRMYA